MIMYDVAQGSEEWGILRMGRPTSSDFNKLITAKTSQPSKQRFKYANKLLAEIMVMRPLRTIEPTYWMERGTIMEAKARHAYEFIHDVEVEHGGFITDDKGQCGCSPDAYILTKHAGLEIKCPSEQVHLGYLLGTVDEKEFIAEFIDKYKPQYQGQMLIGGFDYIDMFSYHPDMPPATIRMEPDIQYQALLREALGELRDDMEKKLTWLIEQGHVDIEGYNKTVQEVVDKTVIGGEIPESTLMAG